MTVRRSPESVLADIPGWGNAGLRELSGGYSNRTYLVEAPGRRAILKIDDEIRRVPYNSRYEEARIQTIAAGHGLAAPVLYVGKSVYLVSYVHGQVWTRRNFRDEQQLVALAAALHALHSMPLTGRKFDAAAAMRLYRENIGSADADTAQRCTDIVKSMHNPENLRCCHNDLVAGNIIATPKICFLDWEYACDNDPCFDLATVVAHHELADAQVDLLLDSYYEGDGARWRGALQKSIRLYDALHWLWLAARPGIDDNRPKLDAIAARL